MSANGAHTNQGGHHDREGRSNQDDKPGSGRGRKKSTGKNNAKQQGGLPSQIGSRDKK